MRALLLAVLPAALLLVAPVRAGDDALVDARTRRDLAKVARDLAALGLGGEADVVCDVLARLGEEADDVSELRRTCARDLARTRPSSSRLRSVRRRLVKLVSTLSDRTHDAAADDRLVLARALLRLDGSNAYAHDLVGDREVDGVWLPPEKADHLDGAARVRDILRRARKRAFDIERGTSRHPLLPEVYPCEANKVSWKNVEVHGCLPHDRLERILREALRARSVSSEILDGSPGFRGPRCTFLLFHTRPGYELALEKAVERGDLPRERLAASKELTGAWVERGRVMAVRLQAEMPALSIMLYHLSDWHGSRSRRVQPTLRAGHVNWVCLSFLGVPMPGVGWIEEGEVARDGSSATLENGRERAVRQRMAKAGILGCRSWIAYLAARREDPPWSETMVGRVGELRGTPLLKATMVVAYLQEQGRLKELMRATAAPETDGVVAADPAEFEAALGTDLVRFEAGWRRWLLPLDAGVLGRLSESEEDGPDEQAVVAAEELDRMRAEAFAGRKLGVYEALGVEPELSAGALAHARYLGLHPEQLEAWPDAHEEWPDREGFSVEGSGAGLRSVIAPGVRTPREALDGWMATFYHRLPLLEPGLLAIGWGLEGGVGVLDCGSLVEPHDSDEVFVLWPPDGAKDVPLRFRAELPNPVPGESQARWGYPVTIQGGVNDPALSFTLFLGDPEPGHEVDGHLSTPWAPTNPELAPAGAACLIPKAPLRPGTTYTAVAVGLPRGQRVQWSFRTARR